MPSHLNRRGFLQTLLGGVAAFVGRKYMPATETVYMPAEPDNAASVMAAQYLGPTADGAALFHGIPYSFTIKFITRDGKEVLPSQVALADYMIVGEEKPST